MQQDAQTKAELARYQDELARKRMEVEHEKQRQRNGELVALQVRAHDPLLAGQLRWCACTCVPASGGVDTASGRSKQCRDL